MSSSLISRASLVVRTSFRVPEFGMRTYDPLCSASATLLASFDKTFPCAHHLVVNSHVVLPWQHLAMYPAQQAEWLRHVESRHCKYEIQVVHDDGSVLASVEAGSVRRAPTSRDLAALYLFDEAAFNDLLTENSITVLTPELAIHHKLLADDMLEIPGHLAQDNILSPLLVEATLQGRTQHQTFLKTAQVLPQGMCGAPALLNSSCCGIIDGIVPELLTNENEHVDQTEDKKLRRQLAGCASMIPAFELATFIEHLEQDDPELRTELLTRHHANA